MSSVMLSVFRDPCKEADGSAEDDDEDEADDDDEDEDDDDDEVDDIVFNSGCLLFLIIKAL